ncbi:adenylate/guanylate cyclase domain-containing protein [Rhodococcus rhodnii]|nr:adenylate/guanylate cyclase domain-containing protein [Rhodococcus rhodnii]TXG92484.1 adenylate/guanylate cyclase domain-containing protein [Rhodococcus rhodnii]
MRDIQSELEESLLGGPPRYTQHEVAERAGVTREWADRLWVSMGFALDLDPDAVMFTDSDVDALAGIARLVETGVITADREVAAARAVGQAMSRLAEWQVALVSTHILEVIAGSGETDPARVRARVAELNAEILPAVEALHGYVWRRHVASATGHTVGTPEGDGASRVLTVGFADIVGYTSLTRKLGARGLGELLERFESASTEVITGNRGRVVKTVGDEVMFAVEDPAEAVEVALRLHEQVLVEESDPTMRIGLALGPTLVRFGDLYGSVVNTAARLTGSARPGSILVDRAVADAVADDERFTLRHLRPRRVRGISRLEQFVVRRA